MAYNNTTQVGPIKTSSLLVYCAFGTLGLVIGTGNFIIVCAIAKYKALRKSKAYLLILALALADATNMIAYFFGDHKILIYCVFGILSLTVRLANLIIVCAVAKNKAPRRSKAYLLIMALAVSDSFNMSVDFFGGYYWVLTLVDGTGNTLVTPWHCMLTAHNMIWIFSQSQSTLMLVVVSIDRFISMVAPFWYLTLGTRYARSMIICAFLYTWIIGGFGAVMIYISPASKINNTVAFCFTPNMFENSGNELYGQYWSGAPTLFALASVILYFVIGVLYRRGNVGVTRRITRKEAGKLRRERKMSVVLGISCISTVVFYVLPYLAAVITTSLGFTTVNNVFGLITMINPAVNVIIYPLRLQEMKQAIKSLFTWKEMPIDRKLWFDESMSSPRKLTKSRLLSHSESSAPTQFLNVPNSLNHARTSSCSSRIMINYSQTTF